EPHAHDLVRQGTAGRGVQRHLVLVAEPPRRHGAQRELLNRSATPPPVTWEGDGPAPSGAGRVFFTRAARFRSPVAVLRRRPQMRHAVTIWTHVLVCYQPQPADPPGGSDPF